MIKVFLINESEEWNKVVKSFNDYDIYYLSSYVKAFQIHGDGEPMLFYYEGESSRGINVVMKRDISNDIHFKGILEENKYFDFATPYGYGGWIIEGEINNNFFKEYENWCNNNNIVSEFVRFHPLLNNFEKVKDFYETIYLGPTVSIKLGDPEEIWTSFNSKNRNVIRKAINNNIEIFTDFSKESLSEFKKLYDATMIKDGAIEYYFFKNEFYDSIYNDLKENCRVFYAKYDGKIVSSALIINGGKNIHYHLSGSDINYRNLAPSNLLLYKVAEWGSLNGYDEFHLGGGVGASEDNLFSFKKAFTNKEFNKYYIGKKIYRKDIYELLCSYRKDLNESTNYFPKYRR